MLHGMRKCAALLSAIAAFGIFGSSESQAFPIATAGTEGFSIVVGTTDNIIAKYEGNSAAYTNLLYLGDTFLFNNQASTVGSTVDLGSFAIGTVLTFRLLVTNTGYEYFTGAASLNPDKQAHARVQSEYQPGTTLVSFEDLFNGPFEFNDLSFSFTNTVAVDVGATPIPGALPLFAGGLGVLGLVMHRRRSKAV